MTAKQASVPIVQQALAVIQDWVRATPVEFALCCWFEYLANVDVLRVVLLTSNRCSFQWADKAAATQTSSIERVTEFLKFQMEKPYAMGCWRCPPMALSGATALADCPFLAKLSAPHRASLIQNERGAMSGYKPQVSEQN